MLSRVLCPLDMSQNRRSFLATLGGATLGLAYGGRSLGALVSAPEQRAKLSRIGIQLYTLRRQAGTDLAGTLGQLAKIGYKEIEFAGYYNHPATEVREILDKNGLTAPSAHIGINLLEGDAAAQTFADAKTVGHEWITVPSLPGKQETVDDWKARGRAIQRGGDAGEVGRISVRVSQPQRRAPKGRRRAAAGDPDERDRSGARVVRDGHLLGGERRRRIRWICSLDIPVASRCST